MYGEAVSYKCIILNKNQSNFDILRQTYQTMKYQAQITRAAGLYAQADSSISVTSGTGYSAQRSLQTG